MRITLLFALTLALIAVLYVVGYQYSLLWRFWWYDIILHTLGGLAIGLFVARCNIFFGTTRHVLPACMSALVIGAGWEVFEVYTGLPESVFLSYAVDTAKDMLMDVTGALMGVYVATRV